MEFFIYLCNMFRKRHDILDCSTFRERTATSYQGDKRANLLSKE